LDVGSSFIVLIIPVYRLVKLSGFHLLEVTGMILCNIIEVSPL
jgi:hypothetical protein